MDVYLPRVLVLAIAVLGLIPGVYMMMWFGWLSAGPGWPEQQVGIVAGMSISGLWSAVCMLRGAAAVYSGLRAARRDADTDQGKR